MAGAEQKIIDVKIKGVNDLLKLKKALKDLKDEQKKVTEVNKESEKEWKDKERAIDKATVKVKQNRKALLAQTSAQKKSTSSGKKMGASMLKMAATITAVIGTVRVLSRVFVSAFKTFTDFEFSMAKVRAISGATTQQFMELTESAKELGRTTFFTATQVAELQVNFSKLGFSADEILKVQAATLDLAMATGSDLARAATVAGSAVRGFGLDASQAGRVVDVMAVAFTSSALDIEKWQTSMTKVSAIAAGMGVDIEGVAAVMGTLSDTGIEASIAGTSLRNIFLKMSNPTEALAKRIGFTVNSTEDMVKALKLLKKSQIGQLEMQGLVDKRQVIAMQTMINNVDAIEDYTFALDNATGAGREMAAIMEDSTKGAFKRFSSALEGLFLVFSEKIAPMINKITKGMRGWIEVWTKASDKKISDRMAIQAREMKKLFKVINSTAASENSRQMALKELNRKYGEYLEYQVTDIEDAKLLKKAQDDLTQSFKERMAVQIVREEYTEYLRENEKRLNDAYKLRKEMAALDDVIETKDGKLFLKIKSRQSIISKGNKEAMADAQAFWDWLSPLNIDKVVSGEEKIEGFWQQMEGGVVLAQAALNSFIDIPKEFIKDADKFAQFKVLADELVRIQKESVKAAGDEVYWAERLAEVKLKMKDFLPADSKDPDPDPEPAETVRNYAEELAQFELDIRTKGNELYTENTWRRELELFDKKAELAEAEFLLYKVGDQRRAKFHLKFLKAKEAADKAHLKVQIYNLDQSLKKELQNIDEFKRKKTYSSLEIAAMELKAERDSLAKKLEANKKYFKEWLKIKNKMNDVDEEIVDNSYEQDKELQNFKIDLATELSNTTFEILNNSLNAQYNRDVEALDKSHNLEITELDRKLASKQMSQADYDGAVMRKETELNNSKITLEKEYAKKQKKIAIAQVIIDGALAVAKAYAQTGTLGAFVVPLIIAQTGMQLAAIQAQEFAKGGMVEEYANGGMVQGKSHAQGGEKFAVGGRVVELEGGEAVINKRSTAMFKPQLSAMNSAGGGVKFADGGIMSSSSFTSARFNSLSLGGSQSSGRVVVVESDITNSQSKVKAIQSNASF